MLKDQFVHATTAWDVYKPMEEHNATLARLVAKRLGLSPEEANAKLLERIPSSKRKNSKAPATVVAYRYLKRSVSHFYENLGKAAVKAFVSNVNESTGMAQQVPVNGSSTRTVLTFSRSDAEYLRTGDRFINEAFAHKALLAAIENMFASLTSSHLFEETTPGAAGKTVVCLLGHVAFVVTKVREHLRLRANDGVAVPLVDPSGMNEGHREPWIRELANLDGVYWRLPAACNGLRLLDAASPTRGCAIPPAGRGATAAVAAAAGGDASAAAAAAGPAAGAADAAAAEAAVGAAGAAAMPDGGGGWTSMATPDGGLLEALD